MATGFAKIEVPDQVRAGVIARDSASISAAYTLLAQAVMNLAYRLLQDRGAAEEVLQDTFAELIEKAHQIRSGDAVVFWVRKVAVNHCLMRLRSPWSTRRSDVDDDTLYEGATAETPGWRQVGMEAALKRLSPEARTVLWLHDVEGYTHKEIGDLMGKTSSFSKSQLARAYKRLLPEEENSTESGVKAPLQTQDSRSKDKQHNHSECV